MEESKSWDEVESEMEKIKQVEEKLMKRNKDFMLYHHVCVKLAEKMECNLLDLESELLRDLGIKNIHDLLYNICTIEQMMFCMLKYIIKERC